jgi:hypothetical protein
MLSKVPILVLGLDFSEGEMSGKEGGLDGMR